MWCGGTLARVAVFRSRNKQAVKEEEDENERGEIRPSIEWEERKARQSYNEEEEEEEEANENSKHRYKPPSAQPAAVPQH